MGRYVPVTIEIVHALLDAGTNPDLRKAERKPPLLITAEKGYVDIARILPHAKAGANVRGKYGSSPRSETIVGGHMPLARMVMVAEADVNTGFCGRTTLLWAAEKDDVDLVRQLIDARAAAGVKDRHVVATTIRLSIVESRDVDIIHTLLEARGGGADASILEIVLRKGCGEAMKILLDAEADMNCSDCDGATPLVKCLYIKDTCLSPGFGQRALHLLPV